MGLPLDILLAPCYTPSMSKTPLYPNPWHPEDPAEWSPVTNTWRFVKQYPNPPELEKYLYSGKLSQVCPHCNNVEPAGPFCHKCSRQIDPSVSWFKPQSLDENGKPRRGRPKASDARTMVGAVNAHT